MGDSGRAVDGAEIDETDLRGVVSRPILRESDPSVLLDDLGRGAGVVERVESPPSDLEWCEREWRWWRCREREPTAWRKESERE